MEKGLKLSQNQEKWVEIIAKAWTDDSFKARLLKEPKAVMKEQGITLEPGMKYCIHENSISETHLVLPLKPSEESNDLSNVGSGTLGH